MRDYTERLHDLQRDLSDGDDLAAAMTLIADALQRRIQRSRRSLEELEFIAGADGRDDVDSVTGRVRRSLEQYERELGRRHRDLQTVVDTFETQLAERADRLVNPEGD